MKKLKALLLSLLALSVIGGVAACDKTPDSSTPDSTISDSTPDSTPDDSTPDTPPAPSVFDGIEFSDASVVIPAAFALDTGTTLEGTHTLKGQIISSEGYTGEEDICVTIAVEGYEDSPIYCFYLKGADTAKIGIGDIVAVQGTIKNYKGTVEFDKPTLLAYEDGKLAPSIDVTPSAGTGIAEGYQVITIEQALAIAAVSDGATTERYYIHATVDTVTKPQYGAMWISDETGSISVYGMYSEDGSIGYAAMETKPLKGADVLLSCTLNNYKGSAEVQNARLIAFENVTLSDADYQEMSVQDARLAEKGTKIKVDGVVAQITYASGMIPNGFYLVDDTNSIYVFDGDIAANVAEGNTVTILAEKDWWILDTEQSSAEKYGYKGCNQLTNAWLWANDKGNTEPNYSWVEETTVKAVMNTPFTTDITTTVFKVTAVVKKLVGNGFINYYVDDLDNVTGSYVYTQANGNDLAWLEPFDGKICTVYLSVINAKSTSSGCNWRFKVLKVLDEGFTFDKANAPQFAIDYYAADQFESKYTADPALEVLPSVSSDLLGFEGVALSYASDNTDVIYFAEEEGVLKMHTGSDSGTANVTITATLNGVSATKVLAITYEKAAEIPSITVAEAITTALGTEITVKGIVGPSVVNQKSGFYLFGEDGSMIAVRLQEAAMVANIEIGHEIIIKGTRNRKFSETKTDFGQSDIYNAVVLQNNYGNHAYSTAKFTESTIDSLASVDVTADYTTNGYIVSCKVSVGQNTVVLQGENSTITLYASGVSAYSWLSNYAKDQVVTLEIALCNWNAKGYKACVLAICLEDGTKILNTTNFDAN
ncbi:MAG: hypothetical protein E7367_00460 [Clostridiales bacterium]|nr:hypothetical protein [Clostridiales bacterium]